MCPTNFVHTVNKKVRQMNMQNRQVYNIIDRIRLLRRNKKFFINHAFCDIPLGLNIPDSTVFEHHGLGVVISPNTILGEGVMIYQYVTIGERGPEVDFESDRKAPVIDDGVKIYSYACVLGDICIGHDSVIGAYSLVLDDVPPFSVVYGIPARVVGKVKE